VPDQLSWISHGEPTIRVKDQLFDVILFTMGINWYGPILESLQKRYFEKDKPKVERSRIMVKSKPYILHDNFLYKARTRQCFMAIAYHTLELLKY
jgi:hypothetical protein